MPTGYLLRETAISMAINGVLSAVFYFAFFRGLAKVPVWGMGNYAFDFVPQSFMVALMGTLVPGLLTRAKLGLASSSPGGIALRALGFALAAVVIGAGAAAVLLVLSDLVSIGFQAGLAIKVAYGVILAAIVTPSMLRAICR